MLKLGSKGYVYTNTTDVLFDFFSLVYLQNPKSLLLQFSPSPAFTMKCLVLVFGAAMVAVAAAGSESAELDSKKRAECEMWSKLENKTLPLQNQGHANCTTNADCTGFSCSGIYQVRRLYTSSTQSIINHFTWLRSV